MTTATLIAVILAIVAIAIAAWALLRVRRTDRLRTKFGPEYDHVIEREGNRSRAEAELLKRESRVKKFNLRPLSTEERARLSDAWTHDQSLFVDDPRKALIDADALVRETMSARGYPMSDFSTQMADVSVDHASVIENYRQAHQIAELCRTGRADTEDMRRGMIHYRALFEELLGTSAPDRQPEEVTR